MYAPPVSSPPVLLTLEEFAALPNADDPMELVRGEVRPLSPAHGPASTVASNIFELLVLHVRPRRLGRVWVVDPERRRVTVRPIDAPTVSLGVGDTLTGGRVLPEFSCAVADLFDGLAPG